VHPANRATTIAASSAFDADRMFNFFTTTLQIIFKALQSDPFEDLFNIETLY
jgi:hypothetical protein